MSDICSCRLTSAQAANLAGTLSNLQDLAAKICELAEGGNIERHEPMVLIGECGTGKSHMATHLCLAACRQKLRVRFATAAALVNELVGRL
jgi:DNA replication protein DnaC